MAVKEDVAPKVDNSRTKTVWTDTGATNHEQIIGDNLSRLRSTWLDPSSPAQMSVLLSSTYAVLSTAAKLTNKTINLTVPFIPKPRRHPEIAALKSQLMKAHKLVKSLTHNSVSDPTLLLSARNDLTAARATYQKRVRKQQKEDDIARYEKHDSILTSNPSALFRSIKGFKSGNNAKINTLNVWRRRSQMDSLTFSVPLNPQTCPVFILLPYFGRL